MGAVVSFVEDIGDSIGDVFEAVGDVVEDVGDVLVDTVEKVGNTVQAVIDDPLPVLIAVAGSYVGIPPSVTMGAITAAKGGDLEDIALSMGTAYFAPQAGSALSSTMSSTFIDAGFNEAFAQVAGNSISRGLVNGTISEIKGGSFDDGFAGGFTGGMVSGGVSEVASYVKDDVIDLAQESGLDLKQSNALYNAGTRAFSAGVASEVTGRGDFATSFANSAVGSSIDYGARSLNQTIDEQFKNAATDWNEKDKEGEPIDVATVGAGIPNNVVSEVQLSDIGVDNDADTFSVANVLADSQDEKDVNNASSSYTGEKATSDISILPETKLAEAPQAESEIDFADLIDEKQPDSIESVMADASGNTDIPQSVVDIADSLSPEEEDVASTEPKGALASMSEITSPSIDLEGLTKPEVLSEAPVADNLLTDGLAPEQPVGGLNALAPTTPTTPEEKMASSMGLKPTEITKPLVATVGSLLKNSLTQRKRPAPRAPVRPAGGLQTAQASRKPTSAPQRMDVAKLIPIQKATSNAPPKTLPSTAKLSPVTNIAGLTSLVKKTG